MTPIRHVVPGSWYAVLGSGAVVLLPPGEKKRVPAVWALVDGGAGFDEVLDALITDGLRELSGFALVSTRDGDARVVIRGAVTTVLGTPEGDVRVEGATAATWVEREVRGVDGFRVEVDDEWTEPTGDEDEAELTVRDGIARASGVREAAVGEPVPAQSVAVPEPEPDLGPEPEPGPEPEAPASPPEDLVTERVPVQPPGDGVVARLVVSTGETVDVDRSVVLGRAPDPAASDDPDPRLVALPSPSREISGTHLEIRPGTGEHLGSAVVTDLGSTNGSVVVQPGADPEELPAHVAVRLRPGAVIDLGDGVTLEVVEP